MRRIFTALWLAAAACLSTAMAQACGTEGPACAVPLGEYRVALPAPGAIARPALVFLHGAGGAGADILGRGDIAPEFTAHGYVVIAPDGLIRPEFNRRGWQFRPNMVYARDELAFIRQVLADAAQRWNIDRARILLGGESIGGSLTWYLACQAPGEFAAFAPVAGGFWNPLPENCAGPVKLLHTHGWADATVPLEGRRIRDIATQGDIFAGLAIWRRVNGCARHPPTEVTMTAHAWLRRWAGCAPGAHLELALHPAGHEVPDWWAKMARAWFEQITPR